jgi:hypothetical protein
MTTGLRRLPVIFGVAAILVFGLCGQASALGRIFDAFGADQGNEPRVKVYRSAADQVADFLAFDPAFRGGVRVAVGDVNGDGIDDIVAATGPGSSLVRVFAGVCTGTFTPPLSCSGAFTVNPSAIIAEFFAFGGFGGGAFVAVGNFDQSNDAGASCPRNEIVVGADEGAGPNVLIFRNATTGGTCPTASPVLINPAAPIVNFFPYSTGFRGGVRVAAADLNNDLFADLVVGPGAGGGPHVQVFRNLSTSPAAFGGLGLDASFFAFNPAFTAGIYVGTVNYDGGRRDLVVGAGRGGGPAVVVFRNTGVGTAITFDTTTPLATFFAFEPTFAGGVRVSSLTTSGIILVVPGPGGAGVAKAVQRSLVPGMVGAPVDTMFGAVPFGLSTFGAFPSQ